MRPSTPDMEREQKIRALIIGLIIIGIIAGYFILSDLLASNPQSTKKEKIYFSKASLDSKTISPGDNASLYLKIRNRTENYYEDVRIQISTKSPYISMDCKNKDVEKKENKSVKENETEYLLTIFPPIGLAEGGETKLYPFEIGGTPAPGTDSMVVTLEARAMIGNEIIDTKPFELEITS